MSICRWNHKSDVYIYQPDGCGEETFVIHVRGMTATEASQDIPTLENMLADAKFKGIDYDRTMDRWKNYKKRLNGSPWRVFMWNLLMPSLRGLWTA